MGSKVLQWDPLLSIQMLAYQGLCQKGGGQHGTLGIVKRLKPPERHKKRKFHLPTIFETKSQEAVQQGFSDLFSEEAAPLAAAPPQSQSQLLPRGLPELLTAPQELATCPLWADSVKTLLKEADKADRHALIAWLCQALPLLAFSEVGCSVVQVACRVATGADRKMLTGTFHGHVVDLCVSLYGHEALTTLVETMPFCMFGFMISELKGQAAEIARHRFGYRVIEALVRHCSEEQVTEWTYAGLTHEIVREAVDLSRNTHGNFVVQHMLEYGTRVSQCSIIRQMLPVLSSLAIDRTASCVVQKAFDISGFHEQRGLAAALAKATKPISLVDIANSRCGSMLLAEMAKNDVCNAELRPRLVEGLPRLAGSKYGRRVADLFGLMPV